MSRIYVAFFLPFVIASLPGTAVTDRFDDVHRQLMHASIGYRHRFERSPTLTKLRWALSEYQVADFCELCDLAVPLVSFHRCSSIRH
jgi:hypothetical protein